MGQSDKHILTLAAQIVTAQVRHNAVETVALPSLIQNVYNTLVDVGRGNPAAVRGGPPGGADDHAHNGHAHAHNGSVAHDVYEHPAFGPTVFDDHLVCMECGLSMKMLKRHLQTVHDMTPEDYRAKWGLPDDYPMVASAYAKLRSNLALESGLGLKPSARAGRRKLVR